MKKRSCRSIFGGMNRHFCRRQREDQPSVATVHRCKSEDIPEEGTIRRRILAVYDYMPTEDHDSLPEALKQFEAVVDQAIPAIGANEQPECLETGPSWSQEQSESTLSRPLGAARKGRDGQMRQSERHFSTG